MKFDMQDKPTIMNRHHFSILSILLVAILGGGCVITHTTSVEFKPNGNGPLAQIKPLTILVQVDDQRPEAEKEYLVQIVADIGGTDRWNTETPANQIVQDALASEIAKCGHRVVTVPGQNVDASVKVSLKRFKALCAAKMFSCKVDSHVDAEIVVSSEVTKVTTPPFQISGDYQKSYGQFGAGQAKDVLSAALAEFVHNLTFDSRLIESLQ
jgi:uncharacterized lipoprotein YajG